MGKKAVAKLVSGRKGFLDGPIRMLVTMAGTERVILDRLAHDWNMSRAGVIRQLIMDREKHGVLPIPVPSATTLMKLTPEERQPIVEASAEEAVRQGLYQKPAARPAAEPATLPKWMQGKTKGETNA